MNKQILKKEEGITLIALIITIIILVILAAVSIRAVYNMGIVNYTVNGTQDYAKVAVKENQMLDSTGNLIEDTVKRISAIETGHLMNQYGFYFDSPYSVTMPNNVKISIIFKENGAAEIYANEMPGRFLDEETCDYKTANTIKIQNVPCAISDEGLSVTIPGALVDAVMETEGSQEIKMTCTFEEYHGVYVGKTYYLYDAAYFNGMIVDKEGNISGIDWIRIPNSSIGILANITNLNSHILGGERNRY